MNQLDGDAGPDGAGSESLLELVLAATLEGIADHDLLRGRTVYNARWKSLFGFDAEQEVLDTPSLWMDLTHEDDRAELVELWEGHVQNGWPFHHTWRMSHAHGGYRWVLCRSVLRLTDDGTPARALSSFADVTEEVDAHGRHKALVEAIPDTVLRISPDGSVVDLRHGGNPNEEALLGGIGVGDNVNSLAAPELPKRLLELVRVAQDERALQSLDWDCDLGHGICYFDLRLTPCGEREAVCVIRDVTELKVFENQLLQSQKLLSIGQLAAGVAHEINTPTQFVGDNMRFIQDSFLELLPVLEKAVELAAAVQGDSGGKELAMELMAAIEQADVDYLTQEIPEALKQSLVGVERISKIVRSMKEFSHPGETEMAPVNLNHSIEGTLTVATSEWRYVAELACDFDANLPPVFCLAGEFNQVILNLIVNAAHAIGDVVKDSGGLGRIAVSTRRDGAFAEIRISDTGAGIPKEIVGRVFDPFFTTKGVGKGTGQGLAIAHDVIVQKHGGTITIETGREGGTTFVIRLPLERAAPVAVAA